MRLEKAFDRPFFGFRSILGWNHWRREVKTILFGKTDRSFSDRLWCLKNGFALSDLNLYGLDTLKQNKDDYLSLGDYYKLHPINGEYSFWIDDKITMKYVLSSFEQYLPDYYYQLEKKGILRLHNCPAGSGEDVDSILVLLREKKTLALKRLWGSCGVGFYRLDYDENGYFINKKAATEDEVRKLLSSLYSYLVMEYVVNHHSIRDIWPDATNTMRVLVANCGGELVFMRTFIRFGNAKSNCVDNAHAGGIEAVIDEDTGNILFTQAQDLYGHPTIIPHHPDSGVSFSIQIPHWKEVMGVVEEICRHFPQLRYMGFDVAVTEDGFKIIEINSLSGLMAAQCKEPLLKDRKTSAVYEYFKQNK